MKKRYTDYLTSFLIVLSTSFLIFYAGVRQFATQGSMLEQGYLGKNADINLSNIAAGTLVLLFMAVVANRMLVKKPTRETKLINKIGIAVLVVAGIWFLLFGVVVAYLLLSGRLLEGWEF